MIVRFLAALVLSLAALGAAAQAYPSRPVRMLVGFTPGGGTDINARLLAPKLSEYLGQPFVVENRPGATTNVATEIVAKAPPDGLTLLFTTSALAINASLYKNLGYDALRDLAPVSVLCESPNLLVINPNVPAKSVGELLALARAKPGALNYSSAGAGTTQHLAGELFKARTHTDIVHVPYKGTSPSLTAVIAGEVQFSFANVPAILAHVKSGRLRPLGVTTLKRVAVLPEVATIDEQGLKGFETGSWFGVAVPTGTPREIVVKLHDEVVRIIKLPEVTDRIAAEGAEFVGDTPEQFTAFFKAEIAKWGKAVKVSGAKPEG